MKALIPGHARGATIWIAILLSMVKLLTADTLIEELVVSAAKYLTVDRWVEAEGVILAVFGLFLADQSLHLVQADHSGPPPTPIERWMQNHYPLATTIGVILAVVGVILA